MGAPRKEDRWVDTQNGFVCIKVYDGTMKTVKRGKQEIEVKNYKIVHEHRHVAERILGRELLAGEAVRHIDGNKENNAPDNLVLFRNGWPILWSGYRITEQVANAPQGYLQGE